MRLPRELLTALDHNQLFRDGQGRAGTPSRHCRVSPGRGLCHPGQPPKLRTSLPETCAGRQVSAKRTGDPPWLGDGAARLELPGKVPSAIAAFQRSVTAVREWQPRAGRCQRCHGSGAARGLRPGLRRDGGGQLWDAGRADLSRAQGVRVLVPICAVPRLARPPRWSAEGMAGG